jgi:hypothetical protein
MLPTLQGFLGARSATLAFGVLALAALAVVCLTIVKCARIISQTIIGVTRSNTRRQISVAQAYAGKTTQAMVKSDLATSDRSDVKMAQPFAAIAAVTSTFGGLLCRARRLSKRQHSVTT